MASIIVSKPPAEAAKISTQIPEMTDAEYFLEVLQLPTGKSEDQLDKDLLSRAETLGISIKQTESEAEDKRNTSSSAQSASTVDSYHARTFSTASRESASTAITASSSLFATPTLKFRLPDAHSHGTAKDLSFSQYEKYLTRISPNLDQPKIKKAPLPAETSTRSLFSVKTKRSLFSVKSNLTSKLRWRRKSFHPFDPPLSCICCREDFSKSHALQTIPCGHTYCTNCLRVMVNQATTDESKMPPRCCTQPIPSTLIKPLLEKEEQQAFLKAVVQFSTPWESRIFCPSKTCGEFIPPRGKIDPKHPSSVTCRRCETKVCVMCKHDAHPVGKDCPEDWELESVLKMGEKSGWKRCYKCRNLVELAQGCTHMTCRCKAQFCYICGGIWDPAIGCPNYCDGEEELERRRAEEEERMAKLRAEKAAEEAAAVIEAAERAEAEERSRNHADFQALFRSQEGDLHRFLDFTFKVKDACQTRRAAERLALIESHADQEQKMKERHAKTVTHLEDRQIAAEMELRATLEQSERSVRIRLKHMEAYCDGLGRNPNSNSKMPPRTVTERDLRELGQQYNIRDDMSRLHQSKINVMRDRQTKRMEELLERQDTELEKTENKRLEDLEDLAARFAHEEDTINTVFKSRRAKLNRRWELAIEILQKELSNKDGVRYGLASPPKWPEDPSVYDDNLLAVVEE